MTLDEYNELKVGDKVHHITKNIDLYFITWIRMRLSNKYIAGFSKTKPESCSVTDFINSEDAILVSPEYLEKLD